MSGMGTWLMLAFISAESVNYRGAEQQVDLIELNHFFDEHGRHVFDQLMRIFIVVFELHRHRFHFLLKPFLNGIQNQPFIFAIGFHRILRLVRHFFGLD